MSDERNREPVGRDGLACSASVGHLISGSPHRSARQFELGRGLMPCDGGAGPSHSALRLPDDPSDRSPRIRGGTTTGPILWEELEDLPKEVMRMAMRQLGSDDDLVETVTGSRARRCRRRADRADLRLRAIDLRRRRLAGPRGCDRDRHGGCAGRPPAVAVRDVRRCVVDRHGGDHWPRVLRYSQPRSPACMTTGAAVGTRTARGVASCTGRPVDRLRSRRGNSTTPTGSMLRRRSRMGQCVSRHGGGAASPAAELG